LLSNKANILSKYKTTIKTWDKIASLYQDKFMNLDLYNETYDVFCQQIKKKKSEILELGCGPGNITKYLISKREDFKIKATDVAPSMLKLAKENNPTVDFELMDCREINTINQKFDGIMCGFTIPYLSKEDCSKLIKESCQLLNSDGVLYLSMIKGDYSSSGYEFGSTGDKTYVYYYQEEYFINELAKNNFEIIELFKIKYPKTKDIAQTHLVFIAKK